MIKLSDINKFIRKFAHEWNLEKSLTDYHRYGKGPKTKLIFSKTREPNIEEACATHYLNKKRVAEPNLQNQQIKSARTTAEAENKETNLLPDENKDATQN